MRRGSTPLALLLLASACGADPAVGPEAPTNGPAAGPRASSSLPPSEVSALGAVETVTADRPHLQDGARKAIADISKPLADCLRESLERDPTLAGQMAFTIQLGPHGAPTGLVTKTGSLSSVPSATCVAAVLGRVGVSIGDQGDTIRYAVELKGTYKEKTNPPPLPELERRTLAFDWMSVSDVVAPAAVKPIEAADAAITRCLLGSAVSGPTQPTWIVLRVIDDGSVMLDGAGSSVGVTEAEVCIRRKLEALRFPATRGPFAIATMFKMLPVGAKSENMGDQMPQGGPRLGGGSSRPPSLRVGATDVSGSLPPEVVQRIVRQNMGRFRLCYEQGLRKDPSLAGRVTVTFIIAADGSVSSSSASGDLPDTSVRSCVARSFTTLSFPPPEKGGVVKVSYPIIFAPGEGGDAMAPPQADAFPKIDGKAFEKVDVVGLERVLQRRGFVTRRLPGSDPTSPAGEPVVVLFRDDAASFGVARVIDGDKADAACSVSHGGKSLIVTRAGGACDDVIARIVER
ncbi:MAG: AgmX/PglI C-terminal domain-containing protein [Polyangiaceae bacterium]|nr:AgmX/PglI C-terminal domain-containing protein [Polyangiaceae bacterium]